MPKYQTYAIDEVAFLGFVNAPSQKQLKDFVRALASDEQANEFFEETPPVWDDDPQAWVTKHLSKDDWYRDLTEPEAVAWDFAIDNIRSQFKCKKAVKNTEHGEIHFDLFELAEELFHSERANRQMLRMTPYRFHGLSPEIEKLEPYERIYWPTHAMLDTQQLAALAEDLSAFLTELPGCAITSSSIFDTIEERRAAAKSEATELLNYIKRLLKAKAMWYARIDC